MSNENTKVTIYDVAEEAGVAISTVSRVLNDSQEVAEGTRQQVLNAIDRLQFRPQRTARSLARQNVDALAVAVPSFTSNFYNEMLKGVKDCLDEREIDLLLCNLGSSDPLPTLMRFLGRGAVGGLLLTMVPIDDELHRELRRLRAPIVLLGNHTDRFDCFYWNNVQAAELAVNHLISSGHRRIGMIAGHSWSYTAEERALGYRRALEAHGIGFDSELVQKGETKKHAGYSEEAGFEAMQKLFDRTPDLTAVFAAGDVQAFGAWKAIRDAGAAVPDDIALIGCDNIKLSRFLDLSTIDYHLHSTGMRASRLLLDRMTGSDRETVSELIPPRLIIRNSTR
jgi:LacI family transcriptional regulator